MTDKEFDLSVSNYGTAKGIDYDIALLPWGATEPHNQHLPYLTDAILSHDIAVEAAKEAFKRYGVRAMVLPPVYFGQQNPGQHDLKFCIHGRYETQKAILTDIVAALSRQGVHRLLIINGHGGNTFKGMIRDLYLEFPDMRIASSEWFKVIPAKGYFENIGDHADELETSVMMHYHPELVDLSTAGSGESGGFESPLLSGATWLPRDWSKVSKDTGIGDPRKSTAEKGAAFAKGVVDTYADIINELTKENLYKPL